MPLSRNSPEISTKPRETLRLGAFTFDPRTRELRDTEGKVQGLRRQSSDILALLARSPGAVVSKEDLIHAVWSDIAVTDDSLVQCIGDIRRALGPKARDCIQTVARRGYRLVPTSASARPVGKAWPGVAALSAGLAAILLIAGLVTLLHQNSDQQVTLAALGDPPVIAVLPFANLSGDPDQLYFSDGLTEDLTTDLSQISGLRMISSASSFTYRDSDLTPEAIARDLGASHLVTGSLRRDGRRLRINATLIDIETGANVWASRFDRDIGGVLDLQDEVARAISSALAITLTSSEERRFQRDQAIDPNAYDLLLRGLAPLRRFTNEGIDEARHYFRRAIDIDPDYARAHANLALSYGQAVVFRLGEDVSSQDIALSEARLAVELDPALPQAQFALAVVQLSARNHDAATAAARQSVKLDPNYADGYAVLAQTLAYDGELEDALLAIRAAKTLSPRYTFAYLWVEAHILFQQHQYEDARIILEDVIDRNPAFLVGYLMLAAIYGNIDKTGEAEWLVSEILTMSPEISATREGDFAPYRRESDRNHYIEGLRRAGLPE